MLASVTGQLSSGNCGAIKPTYGKNKTKQVCSLKAFLEIAAPQTCLSPQKRKIITYTCIEPTLYQNEVQSGLLIGYFLEVFNLDV